LLRDNLTNLGVDLTSPTLVITECFLVYLKKEDADKILQTMAKVFTGHLYCLNYEMIHPDDNFGRIMLENIEVSRSLSSSQPLND
jgi:O-methyltransferase involved in polyketide biosynthesis